MLLLSALDVAELLPMRECIPLMADALRALARGDAVQPLRQILRVPGGAGVMGMMPALLGTPDVLGAKVITVFHGNEGTRFDSHQGVVLLFEPVHGALVAVIDVVLAGSW